MGGEGQGLPLRSVPSPWSQNPPDLLFRKQPHATGVGSRAFLQEGLWLGTVLSVTLGVDRGAPCSLERSCGGWSGRCPTERGQPRRAPWAWAGVPFLSRVDSPGASPMRGREQVKSHPGAAAPGAQQEGWGCTTGPETVAGLTGSGQPCACEGSPHLLPPVLPPRRARLSPSMGRRGVTQGPCPLAARPSFPTQPNVEHPGQTHCHRDPVGAQQEEGTQVLPCVTGTMSHWVARPEAPPAWALGLTETFVPDE